jgi:hypothetical protein
MPEKDNCTAKLDKSEEVFGMVFPAKDEPSKVIKPGEESFDFPAFAAASQSAVIIEGGVVRPPRCGAKSRKE